MTRFGRRAVSRWSLRVLLLLLASEVTLRAAALLQRRSLIGRSVASAGIVCIGDSNTFGVGAPKGRSYPDPLRELLAAAGDPRPVVNLAFPGFSSEAAIDRLEESLRSAVPECVLLLAGVNDGVDHPRRATVAAPRSSSLRGVLRASAPWRMLETGWHVVRGDLEREEFGAVARAARRWRCVASRAVVRGVPPRAGGRRRGDLPLAGAGVVVRARRPRERRLERSHGLSRVRSTRVAARAAARRRRVGAAMAPRRGAVAEHPEGAGSRADVRAPRATTARNSRRTTSSGTSAPIAATPTPRATRSSPRRCSR